MRGGGRRRPPALRSAEENLAWIRRSGSGVPQRAELSAVGVSLRLKLPVSASPAGFDPRRLRPCFTSGSSVSRRGSALRGLAGGRCVRGRQAAGPSARPEGGPVFLCEKHPMRFGALEGEERWGRAGLPRAGPSWLREAGALGQALRAPAAWGAGAGKQPEARPGQPGGQKRQRGAPAWRRRSGRPER